VFESSPLLSRPPLMSRPSPFTFPHSSASRWVRMSLIGFGSSTAGAPSLAWPPTRRDFPPFAVAGSSSLSLGELLVVVVEPQCRRCVVAVFRLGGVRVSKWSGRCGGSDVGGGCYMGSISLVGGWEREDW
jgi:hypothetical protein